MQFKSSCGVKKFFLIVTILLIFIAAILIRIFDITDPPLDFHAPRQIHSAVIARGIYAKETPIQPEWLQKHYVILGQQEQRIEPPILEYIVAGTYKILGGDYLWVARLYSIIFWIIGGIAFLFLLREFVGFFGVLSGLVFYLFSSYGIIASRSFQPDSLMVAMIILSIWLIYYWADKKSWVSAILAGVIAGFAVLVKQIAIFSVAGMFLGVLFSKYSLKNLLKDKQVWFVGILILLPTLIYNFYGIFVVGTLLGQFSKRFFVDLLFDPAVYLRWAIKINETIGLELFLLGVIGIFLLGLKPKRWMMFGYLGGYLIFGLIFIYYFSTHDYYQLIAYPMIGVGIASIFDLIVSKLKMKPIKWFSYIGLILTVSIWPLFNIWQARALMKKANYRGQITVWEEAGSLMGYQAKVLGLCSDYCVPLIYWGNITPKDWKTTIENYDSELSEEDFRDLFIGMDYFMVTDMEEFDQQEKLKSYLANQYEIVYQNDTIILFDLNQ